MVVSNQSKMDNGLEDGMDYGMDYGMEQWEAKFTAIIAY